MSNSINPEILEKIRQHLLRQPGEFKWSPIAVILKLDVLDMYEHLKWLRENEFTRNDRARVYWNDRTIDEFRLLVPALPEPVPKVPKPPKVPKASLNQCLTLLEKITFSGQTIYEIDRRVPGFDSKILKSAIMRSGAKVGWCKQRKQTLYFK
jgi:hypothetical protein